MLPQLLRITKKESEILVRASDGSGLLVSRDAVVIHGFTEHHPDSWNMEGFQLFYHHRHAWIGVRIKNKSENGYAQIPLVSCPKDQAHEQAVADINSLLTTTHPRLIQV